MHIGLRTRARTGERATAAAVAARRYAEWRWRRRWSASVAKKADRPGARPSLSRGTRAIGGDDQRLTLDPRCALARLARLNAPQRETR